jgi:SAM-dependent MidA family methyltransferase
VSHAWNEGTSQLAGSMAQAGGQMNSALREYIRNLIGREGAIPFSRFMELCLYGVPQQNIAGYYTRGQEQFGKGGDFYTSSDVHAVFGRLLARQFREMWQMLGSPPRLDLIELGPGRGLLAQDVLDWSEKKFPEFFAKLRYVLIERSESLRVRLEDRFAGRVAAGKVKVVRTVQEIAAPAHFIAFGNEFLDALPVEVVSERGELRVGLQGERFVECFAPPQPRTAEFLDRYGIWPAEGERVEAAPQLVDAVSELAAALPGRGFLMFIDYGYTRDELLAGRHRDTLKAIQRHSISPSPYQRLGEQDITADVNFTAVAAAAAGAGLETLGLVTQAQFLIGIGETSQFADAFEDCRLPQEQAKVALQLKHLATPAGMGERFHVLVAERGVPREKAQGLSGLTFSRLQFGGVREQAGLGS